LLNCGQRIACLSQLEGTRIEDDAIDAYLDKLFHPFEGDISRGTYVQFEGFG
jgi:hypothetical protein